MPRRSLAELASTAAFFVTVSAGAQTPPPQPQPFPPPPPTYAPPPYQPYPPQPYGQQPYYAAPPELPYKSGEMIPAGYHPEERPRKGLTIAGASVLGAFYFPSLLIGASSEQKYLKYLMIPVVGPWISIGERPRCSTSDGLSCVGAFFGNVLLVFDGVAQLTGATLLTIGFTAPKTVLIRDDLRQSKPQWQLRPTAMSNGGFGIALGGEIL